MRRLVSLALMLSVTACGAASTDYGANTVNLSELNISETDLLSANDSMLATDGGMGTQSLISSGNYLEDDYPSNSQYAQKGVPPASNYSDPMFNSSGSFDSETVLWIGAATAGVLCLFTSCLKKSNTAGPETSQPQDFVDNYDDRYQRCLQKCDSATYSVDANSDLAGRANCRSSCE